MAKSTRSRIIALLSKPKHFRDWLSAHSPEEIVGLSTIPCECPIAVFLKRKGRLLNSITVLPSHIEFYDGEGILMFNEFDELAWIPSFVREVDCSTESLGAPITAGTALSLLK